MVSIRRPPPKKTAPVHYTLAKGARLVRVYEHPAKHPTGPLIFRSHGPLHRFDHHRHPEGCPALDADRSIYYAARDLEGAIVEVFGDVGTVDVTNRWVALIEVRREVTLLDLRKKGAMRAGSVAALTAAPDRGLSQEWSRYFYDEKKVYGRVDGLIYANAHNQQDAFALYERCSKVFRLVGELPLGHVSLTAGVKSAGLQNNLIVPPYAPVP